MIIYGTGEKKLSFSYQPVKCKCPECGEFEITFHFFRQYVHLFWIPAFPSGSRQLAYCEKCHASYQDNIPPSLVREIEDAKNRTSTPIYLFSASILIVITMIMAFYFYDGTTTHYYPSKEKQAAGKYVNNKPEGKWTYWYEDGKLQSEQYYRNGVEDSIWTWYNEYGVKIKEGGYRKGVYHGKWSFYYPSGALEEEDMYLENRKQGISTAYYENGQKATEGKFERDREQGVWISWYDDGSKMSEGEFENGIKKGLWKFYYPNGQPGSELLFKDSSVYTISQWSESGEQLVREGNGTSVTYYDGKQRNAEGKIKDGLNDGWWNYYYADGQLKEQGVFEKGVYTLKNSYDLQGLPLVVNGNGYHRSYYDNGIVEMECLYRDGKLHGLCFTRLMDGTLISEVYYAEGKYEGKAKFYHRTGELGSEGEFKNNKQEGVWMWYHLNGKPESKVTFINGNKNGEQIFWSESNEIVKREFYESGKLLKEEVHN